MAERFTLVLVKPSHYDDDGYVIQWLRSAIPSNSLAVLHGLAIDCRDRGVLGQNVEWVIRALDETNTRVHPEKLARLIHDGGGRGLVGLVGVQSNQFPHSMDLARRFRAAGVSVSIGGFHVSGCLAMLPSIPVELQEAMDLGISLYAGEAENHFEEVLRDAWTGSVKPLYNYATDLPALEGAPPPMLPASRIKRTAGRLTTVDAGRGCPFLCSFCTIINVQGRKSRRRSADDIEKIIRQNLAQGINHFFITDDNLARNKDWEPIFDRLIEMREREGLKFKFTVQVDTMCHRIPGFIEKGARAGISKVFLGLESINPDSLAGARKKQNKIQEYRKMLLEWKRWKVTTYAGYILGFPGDTPEQLLHDIEIIKRELPLDLLEFFCLTPLPGSEDHLKLHQAGAFLDPDLNKYDLEHVCAKHPTMSQERWEKLYRQAWAAYYTDAHIRTVMRRATASGISAGKMMFLLLWFHGCISIEKIHPLEGGYMRRKYRLDRRPGLAIESPLKFYPRYAWEFVSKHVQFLRLIWRYYWFRQSLKRDPEAKNYRDLALTPVADDEMETLEMMQVLVK